MITGDKRISFLFVAYEVRGSKDIPPERGIFEILRIVRMPGANLRSPFPCIICTFLLLFLATSVEAAVLILGYFVFPQSERERESLHVVFAKSKSLSTPRSV